MYYTQIRRKSVSMKEVQKMVEMYREGYRIAQISRQLDRPPSTIRKYTIDRGVKREREVRQPIEFYLNKYSMNVYDSQGNLVWVFDTPRDMAKCLNMKINTANRNFIRAKKGIGHGLNYKGNRYNNALINVIEFDILEKEEQNETNN